jgi:phosphatidylethanolamine/phosphatidyl-N-methylethanolamine N-methyltransferase
VSDSADAVYARLAPVYDLLYGLTLAPGRRHAMARLAPAPGESILEIGVGTGLSAVRYPRDCRVAAIDISAAMLERARARLKRRRLAHVSLCRMDASRLAFRDAQFDAIYAPYVMNIVSDPVAVAREMLRVSKPTGRIVLLNHFEHGNGSSQPVNRLLGRVVSRIGVNWDFDLATFLDRAGLVAQSIEHVNVPAVSSVVVCHRR